MRLVTAIAVLVSFIACNSAAAELVEELFQQFGLFGTWAADCSKPATPGNPRVSITTPSAGLVLEDHNLGPDFAVNRYSIVSAERLSGTSVSVNVIFQPGAQVEERQKLIFSVQEEYPAYDFQSAGWRCSSRQGWHCARARHKNSIATPLRRRRSESLIAAIKRPAIRCWRIQRSPG